MTISQSVYHSPVVTVPKVFVKNLPASPSPAPRTPEVLASDSQPGSVRRYDDLDFAY